MNPFFRRYFVHIFKTRTISPRLGPSRVYGVHCEQSYLAEVGNVRNAQFAECRNSGTSRVYGVQNPVLRNTLLRKLASVGPSRVYGVYCEQSYLTGVENVGNAQFAECRNSGPGRVHGVQNPVLRNTHLRELTSVGPNRVYGVYCDHLYSAEVENVRNAQFAQCRNSGLGRVYGVQNPVLRNTQLRKLTSGGSGRVCWFSTQANKFPEYEMPSVTWGVVQGRKERLVSKVIICDYLKGLGIVTDELEEVELPSTVEVMRERVEFLQKIGLNVDDINEYPLMLGCSVRKNVIPVLGYLEKIGIPRSKMGEFVKNYPQVLHASVVVELVPVVKFLRGLDVEKDDIGYVLQKYPELLGFKLEGTMSTSVAYLVSIGVNPRDIGPMVTQYPYILGMRVGTMIKPLVDYLVSLGLPKKILARLFEKRPYVIGYDLEETVKPNVDCLISFGISREALPSVIAQFPQILGLPLKAKMSSQQYFFNLKLKIDPEGFALVVERMPQIVSLNQSVIMKPIEFLLGRGILAGDVAKMVVKCPQLVAAQVAIMKNSFYFFKSEMGRPIKELVEFPEYFTYSLESRIKPRYQILRSKGIRCSLPWFLNCSDQRFEERLRGDYIETESAGPTFYNGGKLELPGSDISTDDEDESEDEVLYRRTVSL